MSTIKKSTQYALAGCLVLAASNVAAVSSPFTESGYTTYALTELGDAFHGPFSQSSPADVLPLFAASELMDGDNSSYADALANTGQLEVSTYVFGLDTYASAIAAASFYSVFTGTGDNTNLSFSFDNFTYAANGQADAQLFVTLWSDGVAVFDNVYSSSESVQQSFILSPGSENLFDILLLSSALSIGGVGYSEEAFNLASVEFSLNVTPIPEPNVAWLMLGGLGLVGMVVKRKAGRTALS